MLWLRELTEVIEEMEQTPSLLEQHQNDASDLQDPSIFASIHKLKRHMLW